MSRYIYELTDWPRFNWELEAIVPLLTEVRNKQGMLTGTMGALGFDLQNEAYLETMSQDIIKSNAIEGEVLNTKEVRSSIARKLGIKMVDMVDSHRNVDGNVDMMMDATRNWNSELTAIRLYGWQSALFPSGRSGMYKIITGAWRNDNKGPMQVISGPKGKRVIHFEAPAANKIPQEMNAFLNWINSPSNEDSVLNAAIAHLWFLTIHPFEDGNGRIARAITDMMLCRSEKRMQRFFSMSSQIEAKKKEYYEILENTQKGSLDITAWINWFLECLGDAIESSTSVVQKIMAKHKFWNDNKSVPFNTRQIKIIELLFENFEGNLTTSKWAKINKCSQDTALRDIQDLIEKTILKKSSSGGRSTNYVLEATV